MQSETTEVTFDLGDYVIFRDGTQGRIEGFDRKGRVIVQVSGIRSDIIKKADPRDMKLERKARR